MAGELEITLTDADRPLGWANMCRLFAMSGGREPVHATFWLLEAPDSLSQQSHREPDGTGLGYYDDDGHPVVSKQAVAAFRGRRLRAGGPGGATRAPSWPTSATPPPAGCLSATRTPSSRTAACSPTTASSRAWTCSRPSWATRCRWCPATPTPSASSPSSPARRGGPATSGRASPRRRAGWPSTCRCSRSTSCSSPRRSCGRCATPTPTTCSCSSAPRADPAAARTWPTRAPTAGSACTRATWPISARW